MRCNRAWLGRAGCRFAAGALTLAAAPALGRYGGSGGSGGGSQQMSFEPIIKVGDSIDGVDHPISAFYSLAINSRGQFGLSGRAPVPGGSLIQHFVMNDEQLLLGPHLANMPVEANGQTGFATLRNILGNLEMNNRGDIVTHAWSQNGIPGNAQLPGVYIANRSGVIDRVVTLNEPLAWWTGDTGDYDSIDLDLKISDDDRVLIQGNAGAAGGSGTSHVSRFDRTPGSFPGSSDFVHTNVAAHGMPLAGGVLVGGDFRSTMAPDGRVLLSSLASFPAPIGFGYTLFEDGTPVLQQGQESPLPQYFVAGPLSAQSASASGSFTTRFAVTEEAGGPAIGSVLYNSSRGVIWAGGEEVAKALDVPRMVSMEWGAYTDSRNNVYFKGILETSPDQQFEGIWKNDELLVANGMDIGDGRTITELRTKFDVSDNGRWIICAANLSDGSINTVLRVYVPAPGVAAMLALSAPVLVGRRRRATRDLAYHV